MILRRVGAEPAHSGLCVVKLRRKDRLEARPIINADGEKALCGEKSIPIDGSIAIHPRAAVNINDCGHGSGGDRIRADNLDHEGGVVDKVIRNIRDEGGCAWR